jgi:hypothetical protein
MSARMSLFWIPLTVVLLAACVGCGKGGVSPTGEGAPLANASSPSAVTSSIATPSGAADTSPRGPANNTPATAAATRTGQAQPKSGGGALGAPLHIPAVIINIGKDLQTEYDKVVADVRTECGGTLCVSVSKEGTGYECGSTVSVNGTQITPEFTTDSQGNQFITVPRGASIVINGNALGLESLPCPSDQPAVAVASDWFSTGKPIGGPGDGGAFDQATAAIRSACGDGTSCVSLKVAGGPNLCSVEPQQGVPPDIPAGSSSTDIKLLRGETITLDGNADGSFSNCPSDNSSSSGGGGSSGDQSPPSP